MTRFYISQPFYSSIPSVSSLSVLFLQPCSHCFGHIPLLFPRQPFLSSVKSIFPHIPFTSPLHFFPLPRSPHCPQHSDTIIISSSSSRSIIIISQLVWLCWKLCWAQTQSYFRLLMGMGTPGGRMNFRFPGMHCRKAASPLEGCFFSPVRQLRVCCIVPEHPLEQQKCPFMWGLFIPEMLHHGIAKPIAASQGNLGQGWSKIWQDGLGKEYSNFTTISHTRL